MATLLRVGDILKGKVCRFATKNVAIRELYGLLLILVVCIIYIYIYIYIQTPPDMNTKKMELSHQRYLPTNDKLNALEDVGTIQCN